MLNEWLQRSKAKIYYRVKGAWTVFIAHEKDLSLVLIVILACLLSYGLGRMSSLKDKRPPVTITSSSTIEMAGNVMAPSSVLDKIVASKNGTKYYFPWCGSGKNIKEANRVYFNSKEDAIRAGYSLAGNCSEQP